jgi:hypothetical protein
MKNHNFKMKITSARAFSLSPSVPLPHFTPNITMHYLQMLDARGGEREARHRKQKQPTRWQAEFRKIGREKGKEKQRKKDRKSHVA